MDIAKLKHDILADISAIDSSVAIIKDNWDKDPELVNRLLPLISDKINQIMHNMQDFSKLS